MKTSQTPVTDSLINDGKLASGEVARILSNYERECTEIPELRLQVSELANKLNRANMKLAELFDENRNLASTVEQLHAFAHVMVEEAREAME